MDSKISEMEEDICKVKNLSEKNIQEFMNVLSADQINTLLQNEIHRIDDWFSKTYYHIKSYLIKLNFLKFDKDEFERLKSKMDFISGCLNEDTKFQQNNFYPNEIMEAIKTMEKNKYDKCTVQIIGKSFARCLLCMANVNGNVYDHVLGTRHQLNLSNPAQIELLDSFHVGWCDVPISLRVNEIFFLPHSMNRVKCCICNSFIGYRELLVHINGRNHQMKIPDEFIQSHPYSEGKLTDNQILCEIYKVAVSRKGLQEHIDGRNNQSNMMDLNRKSIDEININDNQAKCEICKVLVSRKGMEEHINGRNHQSNLLQVNSKEIQELNDNQVRCEICKVVVSRKGLQEHINGRNHQSNLMQVNSKPIEELNVNQVRRNHLSNLNQQSISRGEKVNDITLQKNQDVMKQERVFTNTELSPSKYLTDVYMLQLPKTTSPRPLAVQQIASKYFRCLVCKIMFLESSSLNLHVTNDSHQTNYNNKKTQSALKMYHTVWQTDPQNSEFQQIFFYPQDNQNIFCLLCSMAVKNSKIKEHCTNQTHLRNAVDSFTNSEVDDSLYHDESDHLLREIFSNNNVFKRENVFYLTEEFYSNDFLQKLDNKTHRIEKKIIMSSPGVYNCLLCHETEILESLLQKHCSNMSHILLTNSRYQNHIVRQFHRDWSNLPADLQLHQIYFLPNYTSYTCLCCGNDNIKFNDILSHIYGSQHIINYKQFNSKEIPKCFELTNESIKMNLYPESLIMLLKKITNNPNDYISIQKLSLFQMKCLVCRKEFQYITSHFTSNSHKQTIKDSKKIEAVKKYHKEWIKIPENLQIQQLNYEPYSEEHIMCNKCNDFLKYDNLYYHLTNNHKLWEIKTSISPSNSTQFEQQSTSSPQLSIPECKFAPSTYYPINLLQKMRELEGKIYRNVQMIGESNYRCLLCKKFVDNLDEHISTSDHLKLLTNRDLILSVEKFHNSWSIIDNHLQFQQRFFFPTSETIVFCVLCLEDIYYNKLVLHLQATQHILSVLEKFQTMIPLDSFNSKLISSTSMLVNRTPVKI